MTNFPIMMQGLICMRISIKYDRFSLGFTQNLQADDSLEQFKPAKRYSLLSHRTSRYHPCNQFQVKYSTSSLSTPLSKTLWYSTMYALPCTYTFIYPRNLHLFHNLLQYSTYSTCITVHNVSMNIFRLAVTFKVSSRCLYRFCDIIFIRSPVNACYRLLLMMYPQCCRKIMLVPLGLKMWSSETLHRYVQSIQAADIFQQITEVCSAETNQAWWRMLARLPGRGEKLWRGFDYS
jgi:hypothetical protein